MFAESFLGLDLAIWQWIGAGVFAAATAVGGAIWKIVLWIGEKVNYFLDRQDKFMAKLESNDQKRIEILAEIGKDNAVKARAIEETNDRLDNLTRDVSVLKTGLAVLQDRLPCERSGSSVFPKPPIEPGQPGK